METKRRSNYSTLLGLQLHASMPFKLSDRNDNDKRYNSRKGHPYVKHILKNYVTPGDSVDLFIAPVES